MLSSREGVKLRRVFDSPIFSGASLDVDIIDATTLAALPEVGRVWANVEVRLPKTQSQQMVLSSDDAAAAKYSTFVTTGVDKVHAAGLFGKGVKIGVVDTGVQYTHPALGGGIGPGFKVAGGWDFVGNGLWPYEGEKLPDADPMDQQGHGTHVAGIVAGLSNKWSGVAPNATLYAYKVMGKLDLSDTETLVEAFLRAYDDGMDIITASISPPSGSGAGFETNLWAEVASRIVAKGVLVTIAAGNRGDEGLLLTGSGASGTDVLAVASINVDNSAATPVDLHFTVNGVTNTTTAGYIPATVPLPTTIKDWPVVVLNFNTSDTADGCSAYPPGTPSLTGKIPLVRRGTCTFDTKVEHLAALGAKYVLVYNNDSPLLSPLLESATSMMGLISSVAGKAIIDAVRQNGTVLADFSPDPSAVVGMPNPLGGMPSTFTSWGPRYDLRMKPDIAAPGGLVFSTYLTDIYTVLSGTSQATPFVAGVAALYIAARGHSGLRTPGFARDLARRIVSSGKAVPWSDGTIHDFDFAAPVPQVGNGLVDAAKVVLYGTSLDYDPLNLNDTAHFQADHQVVVTNSGSKPVVYTMTVQPSGGFEGMLGWDESTRSPRVKKYDELAPLSMEVDMEFPSSFAVEAGESKTVSFKFLNPSDKGWNGTALPFYSGQVCVSGNNGEQLSMPYFGLAADLQKQMSPIFRPTFPFSKSGVSFTDINTKPYYSFNLSRQSQDFPKIYTQIKWGTKQIRWDIFAPGWTEDKWTYPPTTSSGYIGAATGFTRATGSFNPATQNASNTFTFPALDVEHGGGEYWWFGKLGNGSQIAPGNYTMRFAALVPFGPPKDSSSWNIFSTPQIRVLPCPGCPQLG
ncbi:peptidase S8/S53 domain-containing protein [Microdochium bolleyi]|uniref:Peptidase S8/S53 domain-containing protein n=1 Tax=Microdochium bolleyi TaxID=196109 RepID=A0A136IQ26_9PEZI|nr:peptidase S8/S53 domain-containing protein [Microdochium bolleyi]